MSILQVAGLKAGYGQKNVIEDVSFSIEEGELVAVVGSNGCGKTTLIKAICGMVSHNGDCLIDGRSVDELKTREMAKICSYIPQQSGITMDISVLNVVLMGFNPYLGALKYPDGAMKARALEIIEQVGLGGRADDNYMTLSQGQKQLCILARAMVADSHLVLMDEPESALDFNVRYRMMDYISMWVKESGRVAVIALHDTNLALNYCDRLLLIKNGRIVESVLTRQDEVHVIEEKLRLIYGNISIRSFVNKNGDRQLVMINEPEIEKHEYQVGCVIMASGEGKRFGGDKLMASFGGKPMISWVLEATTDLFISRIVVTRNSEVLKFCDQENIKAIQHDCPGQNDTVRIGLENMPGHISGCVFCVSDQPFLTRSSIMRLLDAANKAPGKIWRVACGDRVGTPVYFPSSLFQELMELPEDKGGSVVIKKHQDMVETVQLQSEIELEDIDTKEDYELWGRYICQ